MAQALKTPLFIFTGDELSLDLLYAPEDAWGYYEWPEIESGLYTGYDNGDRCLTFVPRVETEPCFFGLFECEAEYPELVVDEDQTRARERFRFHLLRTLLKTASVYGEDIDEHDIRSRTLEELKALAVEKAHTAGWCDILT